MSPFVRKIGRKTKKEAAALLQTNSRSLLQHDDHYVQVKLALEAGTLDFESLDYQLLTSSERRSLQAAQHEFQLDGFIDDFLGTHRKHRSVAIDIGSGVGWIARYLALRFDHVVAIEPSSVAVELAVEFANEASASRIKWVNASVEKTLPNLDFSMPVFVTSGVVFSHLPDRLARKTLRKLDELWAPGSQAILAEAYGVRDRTTMWHVRNEEAWSRFMPKSEMRFFGRQVPGRDHRLGIHVTRLGV